MRTARGFLSMAVFAAALAAGGCGDGAEPPEPSAPGAARPRPLAGSLEWALAGPWRSEVERSRDGALHVVESLEFFSLIADDRALELWPGEGGLAAALAAYLKPGRFAVALPEVDKPAPELVALNGSVAARLSDGGAFRGVRLTAFGPKTAPIAPEGSLGLVLSVDDIAALMALGLAEKAFADVFAALAPGGRFGVIEARAAEGAPQDPGAPTGYVQASYVKRLAAEAGFALAAESELNANPKDARDHPFGVWTLPPYRRSAPLGAAPDPEFDHTPYDAVGEPDRMTLLFVKPKS